MVIFYSYVKLPEGNPHGPHDSSPRSPLPTSTPRCWSRPAAAWRCRSCRSRGWRMWPWPWRRGVCKPLVETVDFYGEKGDQYDISRPPRSTIVGKSWENVDWSGIFGKRWEVEVLQRSEKWWRVMKSHEKSWKAMKSDEKSWKVMKSDEKWWKVMKSDEKWDLCCQVER